MSLEEIYHWALIEESKIENGTEFEFNLIQNK